MSANRNTRAVLPLQHRTLECPASFSRRAKGGKSTTLERSKNDDAPGALHRKPKKQNTAIRSTFKCFSMSPGPGERVIGALGVSNLFHFFPPPSCFMIIPFAILIFSGLAAPLDPFE
jgi:hypothetical protein